MLDRTHSPLLMDVESRPDTLLADDIIPFPDVHAWVRAASQCRININPLLVAAGWHMNAQGVPQIRREGVVRLMQQCVSQAAPQHHFPLVVGECFAFDYLPAIETFLTTSPTLRDATLALDWVSRMMCDIRLVLREEGELAAIVIEVDRLESEHPRVAGYFVELILSSLNKVTRMVLGDRSLGEYVQVQHDPGPQRTVCEMQFGCPIHANQSRSALVFRRSLLDERLPGAVPDLHRKAQQIVEYQLPGLPPARLASQIETLFRRHPELMGQGIERVAQKLKLHPRTLQRRLREDGESYGDIQDRCRFEVAVIHLKQPHLDLEAISELLGFSDRQNFTRAFKRWTGLSPREFRKQQTAPAVPAR